jgi:hypothetical protein
VDKYKIENKSGQVLFLHFSGGGGSKALLAGKMLMIPAGHMSDMIEGLEKRGDLKVTYLPEFVKKVKAPVPKTVVPELKKAEPNKPVFKTKKGFKKGGNK